MKVSEFLQQTRKSVLRPFQFSYTVNAITYVVLPGVPVNKNENKHHFDKGQRKEAEKFYNQVVKRTKELGFSPAEIQLIRGKKTIVAKTEFGPIQQIKDLPTVLN